MWSSIIQVLALCAFGTAQAADRRSLVDWRGDACARAAIPWRPFNTHARLNPEALARVITRSQHLRNLHTREHIHLQRGTEDVIVVRFDVLLSDESLQTKVAMVQTGDDVALIIDGNMVGEDHRKQCVVATTNILLPPKMHWLVVDSDSASILIDHLTAKFDNLEISSGSGGVDIEESDLKVDEFTVNIKSGHFRLNASLEAESQDIRVQSGSIRGEFQASKNLNLRTNSGSIKCTLREPRNPNRGTSTVNIEAISGTITVLSELKRDAIIRAETIAGSVRTVLPMDSSAEVQLETMSGSLSYPKSMRIKSENHLGPIDQVHGFVGGEESSVSITAKTKSGNIALEVPTSSSPVDIHRQVPKLSGFRLFIFCICLGVFLFVKAYHKNRRDTMRKEQTLLKA